MWLRKVIFVGAMAAAWLGCDTSATHAPDPAPTDTSTPDVPPESTAAIPDGKTDGYIVGGLLATYYEGTLDEPNQKLGPRLLRRMEDELVFTKDNPAFAEVATGELFHMALRGGVYIAEAGTYRLVVFASDSVRVKLHDQTVVEEWRAGDLVQLETKLELAAGWHPLEVLYARDHFRAHLQLWLGKEGEPVSPIAGEQLGYTAEPTDPDKTFKGEIEVLSSSFYEIKCALKTDWPTRLTATFVGSGDPIVTTFDSYTTEHAFSVYLNPGDTFEGTFEVKDLWDRNVEVNAVTVGTPTIEAYSSGGLLGHYYTGTNFQELKGLRIDTEVYLPEMVGGGPQGSFGVFMGANNFSIRWEGALWITEAGEYTFYLGCDDGQRLFLDGELIAQLWTNHPITYITATRYLVPGWHPLTVEMYEQGGDAHAKLEWEGPNISHEVIPSDRLGHYLGGQQAVFPEVLDVTTVILDNPPGLRIRWRTSTLSQSEVLFLGKPHVFERWSTSFSYDFYDVPSGAIALQLTATDMNGLQSDPYELSVTIPEQMDD